MRHLTRLILLTAVLAAAAIGTNTASAQMDYTGPFHLTGYVTISDGSGVLNCVSSIEGTFTDAGFPAHGDISTLSLSNCLVFGFIACTVTADTPFEIHGNPATADTLEFHIESWVRLERVCPLVGTCTYTGSPDSIEAVYEEATSRLLFNLQPLWGACGGSTLSATYWLQTPNEIHW